MLDPAEVPRLLLQLDSEQRANESARWASIPIQTAAFLKSLADCPAFAPHLDLIYAIGEGGTTKDIGRRLGIGPSDLYPRMRRLVLLLQLRMADLDRLAKGWMDYTTRWGPRVKDAA